MTSVVFRRSASNFKPTSQLWLSPTLARLLLLCVLGLAATAGLRITGVAEAAQASSGAGEDLTRLLRFMAVVKALLAIAVGVGVFWRLGDGATLSKFLAYGIASGSMAAGPGLIWDMAHVGAGALLLHAGLLGTGVLLWRDPALATRLDAIVQTRRRPRPTSTGSENMDGTAI